MFQSTYGQTEDQIARAEQLDLLEVLCDAYAIAEKGGTAWVKPVDAIRTPAGTKGFELHTAKPRTVALKIDEIGIEKASVETVAELLWKKFRSSPWNSELNQMSWLLG